MPEEEEAQEEETVPWQTYIELYIKLLVETLTTCYFETMDKDFIQKRIEELFPERNFLFY